jgi:hypothetical protein
MIVSERFDMGINVLAGDLMSFKANLRTELCGNQLLVLPVRDTQQALTTLMAGTNNHVSSLKTHSTSGTACVGSKEHICGVMTC